MASDISKFLNAYRKDVGSESFKTSKIAEIHNWIDTGNYALNRIISGNIYHGIPAGRVVLLSGDSATGKTLLAGIVVASAIKNNYDHIFYFDSEGGIMRNFFEKMGCDSGKIEQIVVGSVEEASINIAKTYGMIAEFKKTNPEANFLCVLDSLGGLVPNKYLTDAIDKDRQAQDMGLRAKLVNNMMKGTMVPALKTGTTFLVINHTYDDPAAMYPSKIKNTGGGKGKDFASHIAIQCSKKFEKSGANEQASYSGNTLKFFITKNRIIKPFYETEIYVDFAKGMNKFDGLLEPAIQYGFIEQGGAYYTIPSYSDKKYHLSAFANKAEVWESFLEEFNRKSIEDMAYSNLVNFVEEENDEMIDSEDVTDNEDENNVEVIAKKRGRKPKGFENIVDQIVDSPTQNDITPEEV